MRTCAYGSGRLYACFRCDTPKIGAPLFYPKWNRTPSKGPPTRVPLFSETPYMVLKLGYGFGFGPLPRLSERLRVAEAPHGVATLRARASTLAGA